MVAGTLWVIRHSGHGVDRCAGMLGRVQIGCMGDVVLRPDWQHMACQEVRVG